MFSTADREYLLGMKDFSWKQSAANARSRIRKRIINGMRDLLLFERIEERDREMIFDDLSAGEESVVTEEFLEFVYRGVGYDTDAIEQMVSRAIYNAQIDVEGTDHTGPVSEVVVDIEIERPPSIDEVVERYEEHGWGRLTDAELGLLVRTGNIDLEDVESSDGLPPRWTPSAENDEE